ncbi:MAG: hypothetical protein ACRER5_03005 [Pseudomonas sp.]
MAALPSVPYYPRPLLTEQVLRVFGSGLRQGVTLFAPRRQGKTWFVQNELRPAAYEAGWQTIYIDLWRLRSNLTLGLVRALERELRSKDTWKPTKVTFGAGLPVFNTSVEFEPVAADDATGTNKVPLEERLEVAIDGIVAKANVTLLILDEFQTLAATKDEDFVAALRTVFQKHTGRLLIFYTGSSRDALNSMFRRAKAPLFQSAQPLILPDLGDDFVVDRAELLHERTGLEVNRNELAAAFERLGRSPEFLNWLIVDMMLRGDADVAISLRNWLEQQRDEVYKEMLAGLKDHDMGLLMFLALPETPGLYSAEGMAKIESLSPSNDELDPSRIQSSLRRLRNIGLVAPTGRKGEYELEDRRLLLWLREYMDQASAPSD